MRLYIQGRMVRTGDEFCISGIALFQKRISNWLIRGFTVILFPVYFEVVVLMIFPFGETTTRTQRGMTWPPGPFTSIVKVTR